MLLSVICVTVQNFVIMFKMLYIMLAGILLGMALRGVGRTVRLGRSLSITVSILIFVFGLSIGSKPAVVNNLGSLGKPALLITLAGVLGSVFAALFYDKLFGRKEGGQ